MNFYISEIILKSFVKDVISYDVHNSKTLFYFFI